MNEQDLIRNVLVDEKNIAIVGLSDKEDRDSFRVARYLLDHGYKVIPVNPSLENWNGIKAYKSVHEAAEENRIDVVDIFRKSEAVPEIVKDSISAKPKTVWMQIGVKSDEGRRMAEENGIKVIMDRCMMEEHRKL
ncbi:MAG: CoA-binding protein [Candidatus Thermoplasmatota archaeon]|jgi:hypothetical protein|nr:CoA-binding protein [Candidatus Thermoplasmatota archaeon]